MKLYDITLPISPDLPVWPGDPIPEMTPVSAICGGDEFNVSALRLGTHTGTHLDAPRHLFENGLTVDQIPLETLVGDAWVCHLPDDVPLITAQTLDAAEIPEGARRLLLATRNARLWAESLVAYREDYVGLARDAAEWVVGRGILLLGIDYLSIDPSNAAEPAAHHTLLSAGVIVVEGLDLRGVLPGKYLLACLPLRLAGADGAPARVVLIE